MREEGKRKNSRSKKNRAGDEKESRGREKGRRLRGEKEESKKRGGGSERMLRGEEGRRKVEVRLMVKNSYFLKQLLPFSFPTSILSRHQIFLCPLTSFHPTWNIDSQINYFSQDSLNPYLTWHHCTNPGYINPASPTRDIQVAKMQQKPIEACLIFK